jgi:phosphoglucomutase
MSNNQELLNKAKAKANGWLIPEVDSTTQEEVNALFQDEKALLEAFYSDLEFGTGGLRGVMGVGTMRMNKYTVGMATQGLANYILSQFVGKPSAVAIAYDSRNNSPFFAQTAANVLSANGIHVHLFSSLRPTPLLSFAVRELGCQAGIVITASHNPPEYNGYKVYWEDGAQVLPPHDKGIISEVRNVQGIADVKFEGNTALIHEISSAVENAYFEKLKGVIHANEAIKNANQLKVVYTSIHGSGITMVPPALEQLGFQNVLVVKEQAEPDGDFPTVKSPNPEEKEALDLALQLAEKENANIVLGTDPDADRVGIAVRNNEGKLVLLNGNQAACLIVYYELQRWQEKNLLNGKQYVAKTIVTTNLIEEIAKGHNVKWYDTLTGFKYIAGVMREKEGQETFIGGGEESYGYLVGEFVRDKDAVLSAVVLCEIAAWCASQGTTLWNLLMEIYGKFGVYHEQLVSITMKGLDGLQQIQDMMVRLRTTPPQSLAGSAVVRIDDVQESICRNLADNTTSALDLPKSNVLQFILADGSKISARPSGTEPKIKFYFSLKAPFTGASNYGDLVKELDAKIGTIRNELGV